MSVFIVHTTWIYIDSTQRVNQLIHLAVSRYGVHVINVCIHDIDNNIPSLGLPVVKCVWT